MNLRKFLLALLASVTITHYSAFGQRDSIPLTTIIEKTQKLTNDHPTEKVYLHFDKPYYGVNDTIWFKAYVTVDLHQLTTLSKIVYVDLSNPQNQLVSELKLQLIHGMAAGYIPLSSDLAKRGNYHIRAYTRWMRNSDQAYFFNRTITIGSAEQGQIIPKITFKNTISEKSAKINAEIIYKDQDGNPYINKKVTWKALNDDGTISRGREETDNNGAIKVDFTTEKPAQLTGSTISTDIEVEDKKPVNKTFLIELTKPDIDVQFFPEGGYLINGIRSRVAFKAIKPDGLGIEAKGTIVDNTGKVMANITTQHLGMGVFALMPEQGKTYKANLTFADGSQNSYDLPTIREEGINLSVNNNDADTLGVKISVNEGFFEKNQNKSFYVMAQSGGVVCYAAQTVLRNTTYTAEIPKDKFPTGILQITVFSSRGTPLSERLVFIQNNDQLNLSLKSDLPKYSRRQKVNMLVSAKSKSIPAEGSFSVSVINENTVPSDDDDTPTILSHLLLTSDLRGYIEKPNYYFNHHDEQTSTNLDILMMTQGYRRFSYRNILADRNPPIQFLPEQGIEISGVLRTNTGIPVPKGNIRLFIPDKAYSTQTVTDMSGNFRFSNLMIADSSKVKISARDNPGGSNMVLTINPLTQPPSTQFIDPTGGIMNIDSVLRPYLENSKRQLNVPHTIKEVVIKSSVVKKAPSHADYGSLSGLSPLADHTISGEVFKGCNFFADCLKVAGLGVTYDNYNFYVTRDYSAGGRTPMAIYANGMPVDYNYLLNIDPNMVESVEIFNNDGLSGINRTTGTKGVLVINTKKVPKGEKISKEQLMDLLPKPYEIEFEPGGYSATRIFYSPRYDKPKSNSELGDYRSTIYWNPNIITDKDGNASFDYYNSDGAGTYKAVIEGIDKAGHLGRYVYRYKVQ